MWRPLTSHLWLHACLSALVLAPVACGGQVDGAAAPPDASQDAGDASPADPCIESVSTDSGIEPPLPLGVYGQCQSTVVEGGSIATGPGGMLTLTESDAALTLQVGKGVFSFAGATLAFTPVTASTAVIAPGQMYGISNVPCATSTITSGALALNGDTLVVSLLGEGCQDPISGTLSCVVPSGPTGRLGPPARCSSAKQFDCVCDDAGVPAFAVGVYGQCTPSILPYGGGKITLTQSRGALTAAIDGLTGIAPMNANLEFTPTSNKTAAIAPGQSWVVSVPGVSSPLVPVTMTITSGSLVVDGAELFAFIRGTDEAGELEKSFHCALDK